ncbi:hypothetical protein [Chryseosolibacter indicus]|uniref:Uncharacterized protein n=1 Tax=Chryseosolibacter indicus TaxID=2782351 RepID=A0ABS5VP31_9BACT|nr:hypothetical protein [Chryseosolibacter indicus]MBT1703187.1 hypothetical protein [Chryseosolibacter indicus]
MEHKSTDETIRKKIQLLERQPVKWKKEEVWERIEHNHKPRSAWYYHVAASLALLLSALFTYNNYKHYRHGMHLKISSLQQRLGAFDTNKNQTGINHIDSSCYLSDQGISLNHNKQKLKRQSKKASHKIMFDAPGVIASSDDDTGARSDTLTTVLQEVAIVQPPRQREVKMVIGVILPEDSANRNDTRRATKTSPRFKLKLLKEHHEGVTPLRLQDSEFIIARIK